MILEGTSVTSGYKTVSIRMTDGNTFEGDVNIGTEKRISDLLSEIDNPFLVMVRVKSPGHSGKTLFINKNHIVWACPMD